MSTTHLSDTSGDKDFGKPKLKVMGTGVLLLTVVASEIY